MNNFPLPLLGFIAYSGTGKTTLLTKLLPLLKQNGLRVGVVKHAHHQFDIDYPGKDSYELRHAGASQMLVASRKRMALVTEFDTTHEEPQLDEALAGLDTDQLDLVLVEGFKKAAIPKVELYRASVGKPLMFPSDPNIIAIASDKPLDTPHELAHLDINQPAEFLNFIQAKILNNYSSPTLAEEYLSC